MPGGCRLSSAQGASKRTEHPQRKTLNSSTPQPTRSKHTLNILIWLVIGGVIGWIASIVMKTDGQQGIFLNVVVGIVGAMLGGWLISPMLGIATINQDNFSLPAMGVSLVGAMILLAIVNLLRRGSLR